ncbi:M6 family metalloprotease domain-containing protein, partial [Streptomyces sp. WAC05858]
MRQAHGTTRHRIRIRRPRRGSAFATAAVLTVAVVAPAATPRPASPAP